MAIKQFTFDPALIEAFVRFGYDHYCGDTNWIPPLRRDLYAQLSPKYPFYRKPGNTHRHFLITTGKKVGGRISAMVNNGLRNGDGTRVGTVGFFECVDDYVVAQDLLDAAIGWLREEHGIHRVWGPMNFDIWHGYRFMTGGFEERVFYGEPHNKRYYPAFFQRYGFVPKQHWNSVEVYGSQTIEKMVERGAARYQQFLKQGYRFEHFDMGKFKEELRKLHRVLTRSFSGFLGFTPISFGEFEQLFGTSRYAFHPKFFIFVYDECNVLAGFVGAFLELSDAIRVMRGKNGLISKLRFLHYRRRTDRIMIHIGGKTPEEAIKENGLGRAVLYAVVQEILLEGYESILITLMAQGNQVRNLLDGQATDDRRQYTLYELNR